MSAVFRQLASDLRATNDFFIRTSDPEHEAFVQAFVERMRASGDVYEDTYSGLYCTACEAFYTDDELVDGMCPIHGTPPEWVEEKNWFFRLSAYEDRLRALYDERPEFVLPRARYNEARAFIEGGLKDISLSRASIEWGVPVPWEPDQVIYVWIDALINYTSALTYARPGEDLTDRYWPARWQVLGKDILKFHAVIWPAMLMSAGYDVPQQLLIHGFLTVREAKMSKSVGNVLDPFRVIERYGLDALRFYLFRDVRFGGDGDVSYERVHDRFNLELANDLGNLLSRTVAMTGRYRDGVAPSGTVDPAIRATLERSATAFAAHVDRFELTEALEAAWESVRALNRFVEEQRAVEARQGSRRGARELDDVLYTLQDGLRVIAVMHRVVRPGCLGRDPRGRRLRRQRRELGQRRAGPPAGRRHRTARRPAVPARRRAACVIDTHTHVTSCKDDSGRGARAGPRGRRPAVHHDRLVPDARWPRRRRWPTGTPTSTPRPACTRTTPPTGRTRSATRSAAARRIRAASRSARPGSTGSATARRASDRSTAFRAQLAIARDLELPIVIHCRDATDDCFELLAAEAPPTVILHCFAATERLDEAVERGWYCSFAGNVTYGSAVDLQDAARRVPDELILLETDAPYLSPVPHRGRPNEPAYVMDTLAFVATPSRRRARGPRRPRRVERGRAFSLA